eukprot:TRINITY_DN2660_c0_g1_i1.p1 TRINITY_DN2660_c0_g1~~TRINITY_DN2660_c0_g1_i1.p1  ORF type:complete len:357 (+),score=69.42 TRINITY_DN2660_c0_g1_i1:23-1072(+)
MSDAGLAETFQNALDRLSKELLSHIFKFISARNDFLNLRLVRKSWNEIIICNSFWLRIAESLIFVHPKDFEEWRSRPFERDSFVRTLHIVAARHRNGSQPQSSQQPSQQLSSQQFVAQTPPQVAQAAQRSSVQHQQQTSQNPALPPLSTFLLSQPAHQQRPAALQPAQPPGIVPARTAQLVPNAAQNPTPQNIANRVPNGNSAGRTAPNVMPSGAVAQPTAQLSHATAAPQPASDVTTSDLLKEQDLFLPKQNIRKVMMKVLPPTAKISKEALECMQECTTEFILFVLGEAVDISNEQKKRTLGSYCVLRAFSNLGLDNYADAMKIFLEKYQEWLALQPKPRTKKARTQ